MAIEYCDSNQDSKCWTCSKVCTSQCIKLQYKTQRYKGVYFCNEYEYDGECLHCIHNPNHIKQCLYDTCTYHRPEWRGYCAQENWKLLLKEEDNG